MTSPRSHLVDAEDADFYHCVSRCVRRIFLCGEDASTGCSYEHRNQWVMTLAGARAQPPSGGSPRDRRVRPTWRRPPSQLRTLHP
jgi:hypothetical protein